MRQLSTPQLKALVYLANVPGPEWSRTYHAAGWVTTLAALEARGLAESRYLGRLDFEWRITDAGRAHVEELARS